MRQAEQEETKTPLFSFGKKLEKKLKEGRKKSFQKI